MFILFDKSEVATTIQNLWKLYYLCIHHLSENDVVMLNLGFIIPGKLLRLRP